MTAAGFPMPVPTTDTETATVARIQGTPEADENAANVERVARVIADALDGGPFSDREWHQVLTGATRAVYRDAAVAAILAMQDPT